MTWRAESGTIQSWGLVQRSQLPRHGSVKSDEARTVRCDACGAAIELTSLEPLVVCAHCRHQQPVPAPLLAEFQAYQQQLAQRAAQTRSHEDELVKKRIENAEDAFDPLGLVIMFGPTLLLTGFGKALGFSGLLAAETQSSVEAAISALSGALMFFGILGYIGLRRRRAGRIERREFVGASETLICPGCGAPNVLPAGHAQRNCEYCRGPLLANQSALAADVSAAVLQVRHARLQALRAARKSGFAPLLGPWAEVAGQCVVYGVLAVISLGIGYNLPAIVSLEVELGASESALVTVAGFLLGILGSVVAVLLLLKLFAERRAWTVIHAILAERLGGRLLKSNRAILAWLNQYWVGDYWDHVSTGPYAAAVAARIDRYPVLLFIDPKSVSDFTNERVIVLVASVFPGDPPSPGADPIAADLRARGFSPRGTEGGFDAIAGSGSPPCARPRH